MSKELQKRIYNQAHSFMLAGQRCEEQRSLGYTGRSFQMLLMPAVVSYGFAIELSLKCLLLIESQKTKGHDLHKLFDRLSYEEKSCFSNLLNINQNDLLKELSLIKNIFVDWRYIYEQQDEISLNLAFLRSFLDVSLKRCNDRISIQLSSK